MSDLTIVIPTYNEVKNLPPLVERIKIAARGIPLEIIVVDDNSPDGTALIGQQLGLKVIKRTAERGLGSAIVAGIQAAASPVVCVIDADLSHPPEALPKMYDLIKSKEAELVVGSRLVSGGGTTDWIWYRKLIHWVARQAGSFLTPVKDITSGFFMFDKKIIEGIQLNSQSWKIGLEIMVKGKHKKALEYPIVFAEREAGTSKMNWKEVVAYLLHLVSLTAYKIRTR